MEPDADIEGDVGPLDDTALGVLFAEKGVKETKLLC